MRSFLVVLLALMIAAPAAATEPSGAAAVVPLQEIIAAMDAEIALYDGGSLAAYADIALPGIDERPLVAAKAMRADGDLGLFRSQANDFLHATIPDDAAHYMFGLDPTLTSVEIASVLETSDLPSSSVRPAAALAEDWARFQHSIVRLRELIEPDSPERVCPVDGSTWFRNEWHFPRPRGRIHKGVDLHAAFGTELYAVEDGVVIQANWHWQGGRQIYFKADSTGDVYYYAHLEYWPKWLWTGTRLEAGDYLGLAGQSGNAVSPHLHLGWMPGSAAVELDNLQNPYYMMFELCQ